MAQVKQFVSEHPYITSSILGLLGVGGSCLYSKLKKQPPHPFIIGSVATSLSIGVNAALQNWAKGETPKLVPPAKNETTTDEVKRFLRDHPHVTSWVLGVVGVGGSCLVSKIDNPPHPFITGSTAMFLSMGASAGVQNWANHTTGQALDTRLRAIDTPVGEKVLAAAY
jgi:hypothetical protein